MAQIEARGRKIFYPRLTSALLNYKRPTFGDKRVFVIEIYHKMIR